MSQLLHEKAKEANQVNDKLRKQNKQNSEQAKFRRIIILKRLLQKIRTYKKNKNNKI